MSTPPLPATPAAPEPQPQPAPTLDALLAYNREVARALYPSRPLLSVILVFQDAQMNLLVPEAGGTSHSPDFKSVNWFGSAYTFTPTQAAIVGALWAAWESGSPDVGGEYLLAVAGSNSKKLADLFKGHPAMAPGGMISHVGRAVYRLAEPAE